MNDMRRIAASLLLGISIILPALPVLAQTATPTPNPEPTSEPVNAPLDQQTIDQINEKQQQIDDLDKKIAKLNAQRDTTAAQAELIAREIDRFKAALAKAQLELDQTKQSIHVTTVASGQVADDLKKTQDQLTAKKSELASLIRQLYENEETSWLTNFARYTSFSALLEDRAAYRSLQQQAEQTIQAIHTTEAELHQRQQALADKEQQLETLGQALAAKSDEIDQQKAQQQTFLQKKQQEQASYESALEAAKQARAEIQQGLFTLKGSGTKLSLTQATDMAKYASKLTGVRAALLLGLLKVESDVGHNVGNGHYPDDMSPSNRDAFVRITQRLGLDPNTTPVSARPRSYSGWGGAMGPGQFMPLTWEGLEPTLEKLLGRPANPFELTDAFVATGVYLANRGGTDRAQEFEAVCKYIAGPYWQSYAWYGDRVLAVAKEYEQQGL